MSLETCLVRCPRECVLRLDRCKVSLALIALVGEFFQGVLVYKSVYFLVCQSLQE